MTTVAGIQQGKSHRGHSTANVNITKTLGGFHITVLNWMLFILGPILGIQGWGFHTENFIQLMSCL